MATKRSLFIAVAKQVFELFLTELVRSAWYGRPNPEDRKKQMTEYSTTGPNKQKTEGLNLTRRPNNKQVYIVGRVILSTYL